MMVVITRPQVQVQHGSGDADVHELVAVEPVVEPAGNPHALGVRSMVVEPALGRTEHVDQRARKAEGLHGSR